MLAAENGSIVHVLLSLSEVGSERHGTLDLDSERNGTLDLIT